MIVTDAEKSDDEDGQGRDIFDINGVIPLEASVVGIPANQTAWTRQAIKSLYQRGAIKLDSKDIEARPWLKTVAQIKEATEGHKDGEILPETDTDTEEQKEATMPETKDDDSEKSKDDSETKDNSETKENPETKDDGDSETKDEGDSETKDDGDSETKDDGDSETKDEGDSETKDEGDEEKDKDADGSGDNKKDFDEDVAADEAADMLISKMFTGLYVALDNLVPILMDTDLSVGERAKQGTVVIDDWAKFVTETWTAITDGLGDKNAEPNKDFDLAASVHAYVASKDDTSCDQRGLESVTKKVTEIGDAAEATADANTQLTETVKRQKEALKLMEDVIETMMQLPLQPVTTGPEGVAQRLAELYPKMDTRVVERMARFASPNHEEKE